MQINWSVYQNDINAIKQLWEAAHIDALTKLYNRYGMETWITQRLKEKDADDQAAMLVLDVDNFKYVNDTVDSFDVSRAYASCYTRDEMHIGRSYFYAQNDDYNITPHLAMSGREYEKKCFNSDGIFFCTDIEKSVEPVKSELKRMKVQTLLQVLIYKDGKIIGTLGINNCGYKRLWLQNEIEIIHTIGKLLADTIYQLQQLSEEDF